MPSRAPRLCPYPGCGLVTTGGPCDNHKKKHGWVSDSERGNRHDRGYGTKWDKLRKKILRRDNYLCQPCYKENKLTSASSVDHITPKAHGGTDDRSNLQSICTHCHKLKTAKERLNQ